MVNWGSWRTPALAGALSLSVLIGGCFWSSSDDQTDGTNVTPAPSGAATIDGQVFAANVGASSVSLFAADAQGKPTGSALATATTDGQGHYTLTLASVPAGPVIVVATGGTYVSEADGSPQTLGTFTSLLAALTSGANTAQVNPLTTTIAAAASNLLAQGGGTLTAALGTATTSVQKLFGLTAMTASPTLAPADPAATSGDGWLLAALAGTLEQLRVNSGVSAADLYQALRDDASDGKLDGLNAGSTVALPGGGTLQSSLFTTQWSGAANAYGTAHPVYSTAAATISGALQTSAQLAGVAIGSSGSIAPLQTQSGGTQLYFAARTDGLVKLDMSNPAAPTASKVTSINDAVMRNTSVTPATGIFDSLDGIVINPTPINTATGAKVFAILYSYRSKTVASVNLTDGTVAETATLTIVNSASFSGASASIAGGIADGARGKIWLATADGLLGLDPSNLQAAPIAIAQPANMRVNENLGGDPAKNIVYAPDYLNRGLVVFNLAEAKAYVMDQPTWAAMVGGWAPGEVDGVALDSQYNVALMTPEGGTQIGLVTYTTPSGSTDAVGAIAAGPRFKLFTGTQAAAGSALDPVTHTALFVGEGTSLAVGVLDDPANPNWQGMSKFIGAGASSYRFEPHDPHTVGAFNVLGKPYGFLLQGAAKPYKVVVVNLNAWLAAPTNAGQLMSDPLTDATLTTVLTY